MRRAHLPKDKHQVQARGLTRARARVPHTGEALISAGFSFGLALCGRPSQHFQAPPPIPTETKVSRHPKGICQEAEDAFPHREKAVPLFNPVRDIDQSLLAVKVSLRPERRLWTPKKGQDQSPPVTFPVVSEACSPS